MTSFIIYDKFLVTERWQCPNCYQRSFLTCNIFWLLVVTKYGKRYRCGKPSRRGPGKRTILNNLQVNPPLQHISLCSTLGRSITWYSRLWHTRHPGNNTSKSALYSHSRWCTRN